MQEVIQPQAKETCSYDKYDLNIEDLLQSTTTTTTTTKTKKNKKQKAKYMVTSRDRDTKELVCVCVFVYMFSLICLLDVHPLIARETKKN